MYELCPALTLDRDVVVEVVQNQTVRLIQVVSDVSGLDWPDWFLWPYIFLHCYLSPFILQIWSFCLPQPSSRGQRRIGLTRWETSHFPIPEPSHLNVHGSEGSWRSWFLDAEIHQALRRSLKIGLPQHFLSSKVTRSVPRFYTNSSRFVRYLLRCRDCWL